MKRFLKWLLIVFVSLAFIVLTSLIVVKASFEHRLNKQYSIADEKLSYSNDSLVLRRGHHIAEVTCQHCHGEHLEGTVFFNDPSLGQILAPNLTSGKGGIGSKYSTGDYVRAIRHGVRPGGYPLLIMPSEDFTYLNDQDLAALISYIRQVPPVSNALPPTHLKPLTKLLMGAGMFGPIISDENIDHKMSVRSMVQPSVSSDYGSYLVATNGCRTCHGSNLGGGKSPDPNSPPVPNLTMGSISVWKEADFVHAMHTGDRPGGQAKMSEYMPWKNMGRMTDDELKAVWAYIQSVPKVAPKAE